MAVIRNACVAANATKSEALRETMTMFLTKDEMAEFTGYERPAAQSRWLDNNSIPFIRGGDGRPKVLRQVVISLLEGRCEPKRSPELRLK